ncbi:MAG: hypothetical protein V3U92_00520 [Cellulophaga sp.]
MKIFNTSSHPFIVDFFHKDSLYPFYKNTFNKNENQLQTDTNSIYIIHDIPPYVDLTLNTKETSFTSYKIKKDNGYLADITSYSNLEEYLKKQFSSKSRSKLRRIKNRLEICFNISYKVYHGDISSREFNFLFSSLHAMIKRRFS